MATALPTSSQIRVSGASLVSARADLSPAFGGDESRIARLGSKWQMRFQLAAMTYADALAWTDLETETDTVLLPVPQPGKSLGSPGTPVVDGASQLGSTLNVRGCSAAYSVFKGQWVSIVISSRRYLYRVTADATADGLGDIALPLRPLIRVAPADGDTVEIASPKIEGYVRDLPANAFDTNEAGHVPGLSFSIRERG